MRRGLILFALMGALASGGCAESKAKVKGRLVWDGQPMKFGSTQAVVNLSPVGADDKPDPSKSFSCVVNEDGSFELVASGGELPPGRYQVSIQMVGKATKDLKAFAGSGSPIRRELKPGPNELTIDVAKPDGG